MGKKTLVMVKGPSHLGANLGLMTLFEISDFKPDFISFEEGSETLMGA